MNDDAQSYDLDQNDGGRRPSLSDVARLAGVSPMTVSRVVRGGSGVKAETSERVKQAIRTLGYRPDPALSALAAYRTPHAGKHGSSLAFIDCDGLIFSGKVLAGLRREAQLYGYTVETLRLGSTEVEMRAQSRMLLHCGVRGLLFGPAEAQLRLEGWQWEEFAAVSLGVMSHQPRLHAVSTDYFDSAFSGALRLREEGCKRVGLVIRSALQSRTGNRWLGGYTAGMTLAGQRPLIYTYEGLRMDVDDVQRWLRQHRVDGVLTLHPELGGMIGAGGALRAMAFLNDHGSLIDGQLVYTGVSPEMIGSEGLRFIHHLLLRREFGLPSQPRISSVRGLWQRCVSSTP